MALGSIPSEIITATRFLHGLRAFLHAPPIRAGCHDRLRASLRQRGDAFLELASRAIYANPVSPYRALLSHADIAEGDLRELVRVEGVEGALGRLAEAGVRLSLDEFKSRRPIRRGSLVLTPEARAFDNPLLTHYFAAASGGSRSPGRAVSNDISLIDHEACYDAVVMATLPIAGRPTAVWRPVPPGSAALKIILRFARVGHPVSKWFSQTPPLRWRDWRHSALLGGILTVGRRSARPLPTPEHVPAEAVDVVTRWLAEQVARGTPPLLDTNAASGVRVCLAARERGLDLTGTFFRVGGEPLSPGKVAVFHAAGCRVACHYSLSEIGRLANACGNPDAPDDVHVAVDKIALLTRDVEPAAGVTMPGLFATSLLPNAPKVLINVELGDHAVRTKRDCGCAWAGLGFIEHLHTIRSYEKLTSEGMHFVGADLIDLVEQTLPGRFGGGPTDYQFVEEEENGLPRVSLLISPAVAIADTGAVVAAVLDTLAAHNAANRMMADIWRDGHTLRVVRRTPFTTRVGKIHALHVPQPMERV